MAKRIVILQGHPDPAGGHFGHALAEAYAEGAAGTGHEVRRIEVARLAFPLLRTKEDFEHGPVPGAVRPAQEAIAWAEHLVILYPLWLGTMPALFKGFLEQVFRPGFAAEEGQAGRPWKKRLGGRSARIVVTMDMPAVAYRWYFRAHSLKALERNVLGLCGIGPNRATLIGMVEAMGPAKREKWLETLRRLGRRAA